MTPPRVEPETLATIELKTPNLFGSHPRELFSKSMQMPDDFEDLMSSDTQNRDNQLCFHTMRFEWPRNQQQLKNETEDRLFVQVRT